TAAAPSKAQPAKAPSGSFRVSPALLEAAAGNGDAVLQSLDTSKQGLTQTEARRRLAKFGPNSVADEGHYRKLVLLGKAIVNPLVFLVSVLALIAVLTEAYRAATVMAIMVLLGVVLRFVQQARADTAAARLKAMIRVTATAVRDGQPREIPLEHLVPGD